MSEELEYLPIQTLIIVLLIIEIGTHSAQLCVGTNEENGVQREAI